MTYKSIVEYLIREDAEAWVEELLKQNNIKFRFLSGGDFSIEKDDNDTGFTYEVGVDFKKGDSPAYTTVIVGGAVDDMVGICHSCIWSEDRKLIWLEVETSRKALGIERFEI